MEERPEIHSEIGFAAWEGAKTRLYQCKMLYGVMPVEDCLEKAYYDGLGNRTAKELVRGFIESCMRSWEVWNVQVETEHFKTVGIRFDLVSLYRKYSVEAKARFVAVSISLNEVTKYKGVDASLNVVARRRM
jgi:hypothetical protein